MTENSEQSTPQNDTAQLPLSIKQAALLLLNWIAENPTPPKAPPHNPLDSSPPNLPESQQ